MDTSRRRPVYIVIFIIAMTILVAGVGIGALFGIRYGVLSACEAETAKLNKFIIDLMNQTITIPEVVFNITTDFPSQFLLNTTVQTQYGPVYIDDNITLDLPKAVDIPVGPFAMPISDLLNVTLGPDSVILILSSTQSIDDVCTIYLSTAIYVTGGLFIALAVWLTILSFVIGFDFRIK